MFASGVSSTAFQIPAGYAPVAAAGVTASPICGIGASRLDGGSRGRHPRPASVPLDGVWFWTGRALYALRVSDDSDYGLLLPQSKRRERANAGGWKQALVFCVGIVVLFTSMGFLVTAIAGPFGVVQLGSSPWVNGFIALVFRLSG